MTPTHQCCVTDKTQLKSKYDKFIHDTQKVIANVSRHLMNTPQTGSLKFKTTEASMEKAMLDFRLKNDFESWKRGHIRF